MCKEETCKGQRDPEPAYLNEVDIEEISFSREVGGCGGGVVGLVGGVVRCGAGAGV